MPPEGFQHLRVKILPADAFRAGFVPDVHAEGLPGRRGLHIGPRGFDGAWIEERSVEGHRGQGASDAHLFRPDNGAGEEVWQALVDRGVLVRNCASWPGLEGCLRVTVGTPEENRAFVDALGLVLNVG